MRYKFLPEALIALAPNKGFVIDGESEIKNVTWNENVTPSDIPTDENIIKKCEELQDDYDSKKYQRDRADAYPSWQDQMDLLYHGGIDALKAELKMTKDKYPKPT